MTAPSNYAVREVAIRSLKLASKNKQSLASYVLIGSDAIDLSDGIIDIYLPERVKRLKKLHLWANTIHGLLSPQHDTDELATPEVSDDETSRRNRKILNNLGDILEFLRILYDDLPPGFLHPNTDLGYIEEIVSENLADLSKKTATLTRTDQPSTTDDYIYTYGLLVAVKFLKPVVNIDWERECMKRARVIFSTINSTGQYHICNILTGGGPSFASPLVIVDEGEFIFQPERKAY
jgi:hypothetical protein